MSIRTREEKYGSNRNMITDRIYDWYTVDRKQEKNSLSVEWTFEEVCFDSTFEEGESGSIYDVFIFPAPSPHVASFGQVTENKWGDILTLEWTF